MPIHNLFAGKGFTSWAGNEPHLFYPPGYGLFSYLFFLAIRDIEYAGMLASAISYLLIILIIFFTTKLLFGQRSALLCAFLATFSPVLLKYSYVNLSDITFSLFLLLGFYMHVKILLNDNSFIKSILLSIFIGIAYLTRPEGFLPAILSLLTILFLSIWHIISLKKFVFSTIVKEIRYPALGLLVFFTIALPYILFIHKHTGLWTFSTKTSNVLYWGEVVTEGPIHLDNLKIQHPEFFKPGNPVNLIEYIQKRGKKFFKRIKFNVINEFLLMAKITLHGLIPLVFLWIVYLFISRMPLFRPLKLTDRHFLSLISFFVFLSPLPLLLIFYITDRFLLPYSLIVLIILSFLTIRFLENIAGYLGQKWFKRGVILIIALSFIGLSGIFTPKSSLHGVLTERHGHLALRAAGLWLRNNIKNADKLSIISPRKGTVILFYANGKAGVSGKYVEIPPSMTLKEVANEVKGDSADFLVLDNHYLNTRPQLISLWENPKMADKYKLSLIYADRNGLFQIYSRCMQ